MKLAYVDTSVLVAIAFDEPGARKVARRLRGFDRSAFAREQVADVDRFLSWITWVHPAEPLSAEIARVLEHGYLRGADLWYLACALHIAGRPEELCFFSFDRRQSEVARALGFRG